MLENDINITDITIDIAKEGLSAILVSGGYNSNRLTFSGSGCLISSGDNSAGTSSASIIDFESHIIGDDMWFSV